MITIDGCKSSVNLQSYENLSAVLKHLEESGVFNARVVTDIFLNNEVFSELYPHQAEDIATSDIEHLEIKTVSSAQMLVDILTELPKVIDILAHGSREVALLLRKADLAEAFEVLQDLISMNRNFLDTVQNTRNELDITGDTISESLGREISDVLGEIADAMENEDWFVVADLLEYEYIPVCERWRGVLTEFKVSAEQAA